MFFFNLELDQEVISFADERVRKEIGENREGASGFRI